ncbi:hypothetical protein BurMR1_1903 [Burkholderia sp. MR1]|nr:hypothetical protein BurMR1_1903 [Burkholderia sp. MR1]
MQTVDQATFQDFRWTILHEGIRIYDDNFPGSYRNPHDIRGDAAGKQSQPHQNAARERIERMSNDEVVGCLPAIHDEAVQRLMHVPGGDLRWVADHENKRSELLDALAKRDFGDIRGRIYWNAQEHNPNARNLLAAVSNGDLEQMLNKL